MTGVVTGDNSYTNQAGATLSVTAAGSYTGLTGIVNAGGVNNRGVLATTGTLQNLTGGLVTNGVGATLNAAAVNNAARFANQGSVTVTSGFTNQGSFSQGGSAGATFTGTLVNVAGATVEASSGTIGTATSNTVTNLGSFRVNGEVNGAGQFLNSGTLVIEAGSYTLSYTGAGENGGSLINSGTATVQHGATLSAVNLTNRGGTLVNNGTVNDDLYNSGTITNNGTWNGNVVTSSGSIANVAGASWTGTFGTNSGTLDNAGTWNGANGTTTNTGTIRNSGVLGILGVTASAFNIGTNSGTISNSGSWFGGVATNSGRISTTGTWNGNAANVVNTGAIDYAGGSMTGFSSIANGGLGATAPATFTYTGVRSLGVDSFVNNGILAANAAAANPATQSLTISGSLSGDGTIQSVVSGSQATNVIVQGGSAGNQNFVFSNATPGGGIPVFSGPTNVLTLNGGGSLTVGNRGYVPGLSSGLLNNYLVQQGSGQSAYLQTMFNSGPASGIASGLSGMIDALQAGFFRSSDLMFFIRRKSGEESSAAEAKMSLHCAAEKACDVGRDFTISAFLRAGYGGATTSMGSSTYGFGYSNAANTASTNYSGDQAGLDVGTTMLSGLGATLNFGAFGGVATAGTTANTYAPLPTGSVATGSTSLSMTIPYLGGYAVLGRGGFTAGADVRWDSYNGTVRSWASDVSAAGGYLVAPNTALNGNGITVNLLLANRFDLTDNFYVEPLAGFMYGSYQFGNVPYNGALGAGTSGQINLGSYQSALGRLGANVGMKIDATEGLSLQPFATAQVWREFAGSMNTMSTVTSGANLYNFNVTTPGVGTFGQVGAGMKFDLLKSDWQAFIRGDALFGAGLTGQSVNIGLHKQF